MRLYPLANVFARIVDEMVRAMLFGDRQFFRAVGARNHMRAHGFANLDGREPYASGSAKNQQPFAGLQMRAPVKRSVRRAVSQRESPQRR